MGPLTSLKMGIIWKFTHFKFPWQFWEPETNSGLCSWTSIHISAVNEMNNKEPSPLKLVFIV